MSIYSVQLEQTIVGHVDVEAETIDDARKIAESNAYKLMQNAAKTSMSVRVSHVLPCLYVQPISPVV